MHFKKNLVSSTCGHWKEMDRYVWFISMCGFRAESTQRIHLNTTLRRYCSSMSRRDRRMIRYNIEKTLWCGRHNIDMMLFRYRDNIETRAIEYIWQNQCCFDIETTSKRNRPNVCSISQCWYYIVSTSFQHCIDIVSTSKQCCTISSHQYCTISTFNIENTSKMANRITTTQHCCR